MNELQSEDPDFKKMKVWIARFRISHLDPVAI